MRNQNVQRPSLSDRRGDGTSRFRYHGRRSSPNACAVSWVEQGQSVPRRCCRVRVRRGLARAGSRAARAGARCVGGHGLARRRPHGAQPVVRRWAGEPGHAGPAGVRAAWREGHLVRRAVGGRATPRRLEAGRGGGPRDRQSLADAFVQRQLPVLAPEGPRGALDRAHAGGTGRSQPADHGPARRDAADVRLSLRTDVRRPRAGDAELCAGGGRAVPGRSRLAGRGGERPRLRRPGPDVRCGNGRQGLRADQAAARRGAQERGLAGAGRPRHRHGWPADHPHRHARRVVRVREGPGQRHLAGDGGRGGRRRRQTPAVGPRPLRPCPDPPDATAGPASACPRTASGTGWPSAAPSAPNG